jgi:hypothetical protein
MKRFGLAAVIGSVRQALAIFILLATAPAASFLVSHRLSNPDHWAYGGCPHPDYIIHAYSPCRPPSQFAWQIPLAVVIALGGLGAAAAATSKRSWRHAGPEERRVLRV